MTNNIQNGRRQGRRELDRDSGRGSEAIGAGRSLNAASMNLGREPVPSELFRARPLEDSVREWLTHLQRAADLFSDEEILALSEDGAVQLVERLVVQPLVLLENDAYIEDMDRRERRFWWCRSRVIPISLSLTRDRCGHDRALGACPGPLGRVSEDALHVELTNTPGLSPGDQAGRDSTCSRA
ncbi:MAG: hypothetical protein ACLPY3_24285 [Solirubrobacteraceae bacterium]